MIAATFAIIAGGTGERLGGVPKGLIRLGGATVLERLLALGGGLAEVLLVANDAGPYRRVTGEPGSSPAHDSSEVAETRPLSLRERVRVRAIVQLPSSQPSPEGRGSAPTRERAVRVVPDVVPGRGAPGGVHAALAHARFDRVLCVGADMPFIAEADLGALLAAPAADVVCFRAGGRIEPLLALYSRAIEPRWRALLDGEPSFARLFTQFRTTELPEAQLSDPRSVVSLNTPEDLRRYGADLPPAGERA